MDKDRCYCRNNHLAPNHYEECQTRYDLEEDVELLTNENMTLIRLGKTMLNALENESKCLFCMKEGQQKHAELCSIRDFRLFFTKPVERMG